MMIEGTKEACEFLAAYHKECKKVILKALRYSLQPVVRKTLAGTPPRFRQLIRIKARESRTSGRLYAVAGLLDSMRVEKGKIRDWTKAYFKNYGTLRRRDPGHQFEKPMRGKNSRNKEGQHPENFYDRAVDGLEVDLTSRFLKSIEQQHEKLIKKNK